MKKSKPRLFELGKASLATVSRPILHGYLCPLCLRLFAEPDGLSEEHAPPSSIGGKAICLTCARCNNVTGHSIDAALFREQRLSQFLAKDGPPIRVTTKHGELSLNCEIQDHAGTIEIRVLPGQNNPKVEAAMQQIFEGGDLGNIEFTVTGYGNYRSRDADIAYLKSAYLGAFAKFGYTWVFGVDTKPIRNQIAQHNSTVLPKYRFALNPQSPTELIDGFYFMERPFIAVMAVIQKYAVLLPWPNGPNPEAIAEWLKEHRALSPTGKLQFAHFAPWPTTSEFVLDLDRVP